MSGFMKNKWVLLFLAFTSLFGEDGSFWKQQFRSKALMGVDFSASSLIPFTLREFAVQPPLQEFFIDEPELSLFADKYGCVTGSHPLVGTVTEEYVDIDLVQDVLCSLRTTDPILLEWIVDELLAKVMAYRNLREGRKLYLPFVESKKIVFKEYVVVKVFNLWHEMPAFGLSSQDKRYPSIILFRGTDLSLGSKKSWASIFSDLDVKGAGLFVFRECQEELRSFLKEQNINGVKAKAIGFSLGAAFAFYVDIFLNEYISLAVGFNPPGLSFEVMPHYEKLSSSHLKAYVNQGDIISKIGSLPTNTYAISDGTQMGIVEAHVSLMSGNKILKQGSVDLLLENCW